MRGCVQSFSAPRPAPFADRSGQVTVIVPDLKDNLGAIAAALSIIGAVTFALQRVAIERFYDHFGLSPEDVGVDLTLVIQQTAGGLATMLLVFVSVSLAYIGVASLFVRRAWRDRTQWFKTSMLWSLAIGPCYLGFVFWDHVTHADDAARCAAKAEGAPVRGFRAHLPGGILVTRLNIRADRATLTSVDPEDRLAHLWKDREFVYLGTANGTVFVYDPRPNERRTLRVPASSVIVSIDTTSERFTEDC